MSDPLLTLVQGMQPSQQASGADPLLSLVGPQGTDSSMPAAATPAQPTADRGALAQAGDALNAFGHHLMNMPHGLAQLLENSIDAAAQKLPANPVSDWLHQTIQQDNAAMQARENQYQASTPNSVGAYLGATAGEVAPVALSAVAKPFQAIGNAVAESATKIPVLGISKLIPQAVGGVAQGATVAAASPVSSAGDYWDNKADQIQTGAAFGAAAPTVMRGLASIISPNPSGAYQQLADAGVNTTIGQRLGGLFNSIEEKAQSLPVVGDFISQARNRALSSWNQATLNKVVEPIGETVNKIGHDGVAEAGDKISAAYTAAKNALGGFALDGQGAQGLQSLEQGVSNATNLTPQGKSVFSNLLSLVKQQISPNGSILAGGFKEIDSKLTQEAARYSGSGDAYQKNLGDAIKQLQSVLLDNAKRANPQAAAKLDAADAAWANLVRVEGAAKAAASNKVNTGIFTPGQLMSAVRSADQSTRDRATARGQALLQDWAQNGLKVLGDKVPNSGTFDRGANGAALVGLLTHPEYAVPAAASVAAGGALYSPMGQRLAVGAATARPAQAQAVAAALQKFIPLSAP